MLISATKNNVEMSDVIDRIIALMSPETVETLQECDISTGSLAEEIADVVEKCVEETEAISLQHSIRKIKRECAIQQKRNSDNQKVLDKLINDFSVEKKHIQEKNSMNTANSKHNLEKYQIRVQQLSDHVNKLAVDDQPGSSGVRINHRILELEDLVVKNCDLESKCNDLETKLEKFKGLPPNITQAKLLISGLKKEIDELKCNLEARLAHDVSSMFQH